MEGLDIQFESKNTNNSRVNVSEIAKQIFYFLPGVWKIARNITSQVVYENLKADGYGEFIISPADPNLILYSEKVNIYSAYQCARITGIQKYKFRYDQHTGSIYKYFNNEQLFYKLNVTEHTIYGEHLCAQDKYLATYIFDNNRFKMIYFINGPSKCCKITTAYTKISPQSC